jgi:hypothetical protein
MHAGSLCLQALPTLSPHLLDMAKKDQEKKLTLFLIIN